MASAKLYLTVIKAHKSPEVVASGTYSDILKKKIILARRNFST